VSKEGLVTVQCTAYANIRASEERGNISEAGL
jgi:hypothetical protein